MKNWEDSELADQTVGERPAALDQLPKQRKQLQPIMTGEGGPAQLLRAQLEEARKESAQLRSR